MSTARWIGLAVLVIGAAVALRELWPKRVTVISPGEIRTVYDTVRSLDTAWVSKIIRRTDTLYLERVVLTVPETVYTARHLFGLTALGVGQRVGDTTKARGFIYQPQDSIAVFYGWETSWWTAGPLRGLSLDTFPPRVSFYPPPPKGCGLFCSIRKYAIGGGIGYGLCRVGA